MNAALRLILLTASLLSIAFTAIASPIPAPEYGQEVIQLYRRTLGQHLSTAHTHIEKAHGDHETFKGHVVAHIGDNQHNTQISPAQLRQYAQHVHNQITAQNPKLNKNFIVAATHHTGDNVVHFHTAPRGASHTAHQSGNFHNVATAMAQNGLAHQHSNGQITNFFHHAETAAIQHSMEARGADHTTAHTAVQNHAVGVHGFLNDRPVNGPCPKCTGTLNALGVHH